VGDLRRTQYGCVLDDPDESEAPQLRGQDVIAVRKVFSLLGEEVRTAKGRLQVIVLDHAGKDVWNGLQNLQPTQEWRGRALSVRVNGFAYKIDHRDQIHTLLDLVNEDVISSFVSWALNERNLSRNSMLKLSLIYAAVRHPELQRPNFSMVLGNLFSIARR
jgi:hypothetical protein